MRAVHVVPSHVGTKFVSHGVSSQWDVDFARALGLQLITKGTATATVPTAPTTTVAAVKKRRRLLSTLSEDIQFYPKLKI